MRRIKQLTMKKIKQILCLVLLLSLMPVLHVQGSVLDYAYESGQNAEYEKYETEQKAVVFTYDEALQMAIENSLPIQDIDTRLHNMHLDLRYMLLELEVQFFGINARMQIERTETSIIRYTRRLHSRIQEWERLHHTREERIPGREARHSLYEFERQIENLRLHRQQTELIKELALRSATVNLLEIELNIAVLQEELNFAHENLRRLTLANELGIVSVRDLNDAQHGLSQGYVGLEELLRNQYTARRDLNYLIGQPLSQYTVIEFDLELIELPQNIEAYIYSVVANSLTIRQSQLQLESVLGERWIYTGNNQDIRISIHDRQRLRTSNNNPDIIRIRNRVALQDAVERAEQGHEQAIRTLEAAINRGFTDLEGLLDLEAALERELTQAQTALDVAITSFDLGRATRLDIEAARLAIFQVEQDIEKLRNSMWILTFILENPDLL